MARIGIIGLGNMGEAILKSLLSGTAGKANLICAETKADRARYIEKTYGVKCFKKPEEAARKADQVILAVKPQDSKPVIQAIAPFLDDRKVLISIMAGITTSSILSVAGKPIRIIRVMPNMNVKVGQGAMGMTANEIATPSDVEEAKRLFSTLGTVAEVKEDLMDAVTALGGSGPAFVCLFIEALIDGAVKLGIPRDKASMLALGVVGGTVKMLEEEALHPTILKEMVTSPGGTTMAGLAVLEDGALKGTVMRALERACRRAKELSL